MLSRLIARAHRRERNSCVRACTDIGTRRETWSRVCWLSRGCCADIRKTVYASSSNCCRSAKQRKVHTWAITRRPDFLISEIHRQNFIDRIKCWFGNKSSLRESSASAYFRDPRNAMECAKRPSITTTAFFRHRIPGNIAALHGRFADCHAAYCPALLCPGTVGHCRNAPV